MNNISRLLGKRNLSIGVLGLGKSNEGVIQYLRKKNPNLKITVRSDNCIDASRLKPTAVFSGEDVLKDITEDALFLSPSAKRNKPELLEAEKNGVIISSDAEMFFELTDTLPICVTGSDGKSTTARLISDVLNASGTKALPCGNFGKSLSSLLDTDVFPIVELSSFQLNSFSPRSSRALITNITPNHLDWHSTFEDYVSAKMNITKNAEKIIFDADCETLRQMLKSKNVFSKTSLTDSYEKLKAIGGAENYVTYKNGIIYINGSSFADVTSAKKREPYTIRNFLLTAAATFDIASRENIEKVLNSFPGLPHRSECFFDCGGIKFLDSSIDSSPERTIKTLSALDGSVIAIIGGKGKNLPLDTLADILPSLCEGAVLLGDVGQKLSHILVSKAPSFKFDTANGMKNAVIKAIQYAKSPSTIILSPAATSFDLYKNFEERGNDFKNIVLSLYNNSTK